MYYPKSQIKTGLFTNGGEFYKKGTSPSNHYVGAYYEVSTGKKYVGDYPLLGDILLLPLIGPGSSNPTPPPIDSINVRNTTGMTNYWFWEHSNNENVIRYTSLIDIPDRIIPIPVPSTPTQEDITIGYYQRYFAKKNNESIYIEITEDMHTLFQKNDTSVAIDLYETVEITYYLNDHHFQNKKSMELIEKQKNWYGFYSAVSGQLPLDPSNPNGPYLTQDKPSIPPFNPGPFKTSSSISLPKY
tara:strand:+ start:250 stop:978 length:729 start_codon:yes stop_codon:yes gene_type:complete